MWSIWRTGKYTEHSHWHISNSVWLWLLYASLSFYPPQLCIAVVPFQHMSNNITHTHLDGLMNMQRVRRKDGYYMVPYLHTYTCMHITKKAAEPLLYLFVNRATGEYHGFLFENDEEEASHQMGVFLWLCARDVVNCLLYFFCTYTLSWIELNACH